MSSQGWEGKTASQAHFQGWEIDGVVDCLHADFLKEGGTNEHVSQTAWWVTRYLADRLLELLRLEQRRCKQPFRTSVHAGGEIRRSPVCLTC
ncbi:HrpW-specific chaperone [Erwinia tracheiphila PSU-1]|nr:HrpW-specific chaperone [Erwinia tracheiphila PSU-1]